MVEIVTFWGKMSNIKDHYLKILSLVETPVPPQILSECTIRTSGLLLEFNLRSPDENSVFVVTQVSTNFMELLSCGDVYEVSR